MPFPTGVNGLIATGLPGSAVAGGPLVGGAVELVTLGIVVVVEPW